MLTTKQDIFITVGFLSVFFILLIVIIVITAVQYYNRKKKHLRDLSSFQKILIQSQLEVQEHTMQTIGADLHDNIGQLLSLTAVTLKSIDLVFVEDKSNVKITSAIELTTRSIQELRHLGKLIQGNQLIANGLIPAIEQEISWIQRSLDINVQLLEKNDLPVNDSQKDLIIFRIIQEIFNNIIKHANAASVAVEIEYDDNTLFLKVSDDGIGFVPDMMTKSLKGMGLYNITNRAEILGGKATISSQPNEGTVVSLQIPYL